ncbi:MAG: DUF4118 domain-containing protein [Anaerolineae bacterium]|nr:DUF4118 domain-containing protein [Anaerolineae bacterium]
MTLTLVRPRQMNHEQEYISAVAIVVICTLIAGGMFPHFAPANLIMVYLVGVVVTATRFGRSASILASVLSVAAFNFFFVHPYLTFVVSDTQYLVTFAVMLLVALTISTLTAQVRQQAALAHQREQRTASLYALSHEFANKRELDDLLRVAARHISQVFDSQVAVLLPDPQHELIIHTTENFISAENIHEQGVALWAFEHRQPAGFSTPIIPGARGLYIPMLTAGQVVGIVGVYPREREHLFIPEQLNLLETIANQTALAIERTQLAHAAEASRVQIETERLRNSLLSSISHDLRTPLASITGAASSLIQNVDTIDRDNRLELQQIIFEEAERLNRLVSNLLDMTRIESGAVHIEKKWDLLEEVVGSTLLRMQRTLSQHRFEKNLPQELLLVPMDSILIEQVLVNLIENAVKYSPTHTLIQLNIQALPDEVMISLADEGTGIPAGLEERIFEKFYRVAPENVGGSGLGLAICHSIVTAHGGRIRAESRPGGGSIFRFTLPLEGQPPEVIEEDE